MLMSIWPAPQIAEAHADMPVADVAAIHIGLARFAGAVYPENLEHIDAVLAACAEVGRGNPRAIFLLTLGQHHLEQRQGNLS